MKFFSAITIAALAAFAAAASDMPPCAQSCVEKYAPEVGCSADDTACQCAHQEELQEKGVKCVLNSCSSEDAMKAAQVARDSCPQ
ncbi:hypothetical protein BKCO1_300092 [Neofusicoccum parvum]|uniref:Uncharacterized protein n=2 Tax=Neofusicoccum parvum TaxID=310453 RepID=A0ACB5S3N7_9PEZI|nr:putative cfem domain-containing protein [Neofusicoccum parvum UCRNP2]GME27420.1 hypothetical protein BKCO1_300092 [Neofusicoccum parvum]GME62290.1 hypothetical protein BKCO1_300092 [Neofusicoccum parvum]